jgi:hypothetical protein
MRPSPSMSMRGRVGLLALAGLCGLTACTTPFDPYNRLTGFRVLAVVATPSTPGPQEATTLSALAYLPDVGVGIDLPGITYEWSWCPFPGNQNAGYECQVTADQIAQLAAAGINLPPLNLGTGAKATLTNTVDPAALARLCAGVPGTGAGLAPDCVGGFPVQIKVTARTATDAIVAVSEIRLRFDPATSANTAPTVDGLAAVINDVDIPIGPVPMATLPRNKDTVIKAMVSPAASEPYLGRDDNMQPAMLRERLSFTWFVETGDTESERTGYLEGAGTLERNLRNKWNPGLSKDYPKNQARLVVVARDNRGGVGWHDGLVLLEALP